MTEAVLRDNTHPRKKGLKWPPGSLVIIPLIMGALVNTFVPEVLNVGSFTSALFRDGAGALLGLFFFCMGAQIDFRSGPIAIEKGAAICIGKVAAGVTVGLCTAFYVKGGNLWGLSPLAIIAAMTNSNATLFAALTKEFGNKSDQGAVAMITFNEGPFVTLVALGAAGLATFPYAVLIGLLLPLILGFIVGNVSSKARAFVAPGEMLLIPFLGFIVGRGINFKSLITAGLQGIPLGLMTVCLSGGAAIGCLYLVHVIRGRPVRARNVVAGAAEATTAGNAIATPAAVALVDPSYHAIQSVATSQVAAATVTTALLVPLFVLWVSRWQASRGTTPEAEDAWNFRSDDTEQLIIA